LDGCAPLIAICIDPAPLIIQDHSGARPAAVDAGATLMKIFPLVVMLGIGLTGTAIAEQRLAVADFDFLDTSGEVRPQEEEQIARMALFLKTLRGEIDQADIFEVVIPDCADGCSPARTSLEDMASATERVEATLLLVGRIHKISTLIGEIKIYVIDLKGDQVVCERFLSYRGDNDEAWSRAATFAAKDIIQFCRP
jgi:hypothetical protein